MKATDPRAQTDTAQRWSRNRHVPAAERAISHYTGATEQLGRHSWHTDEAGVGASACNTSSNTSDIQSCRRVTCATFVQCYRPHAQHACGAAGHGSGVILSLLLHNPAGNKRCIQIKANAGNCQYWVETPCCQLPVLGCNPLLAMCSTHSPYPVTCLTVWQLRPAGACFNPTKPT